MMGGAQVCMDPVSVLVVIVNYRTPALALDAVAALEGEVLARGDTHVVVVDNGSGDGSADRLAQGVARRGLGGWCTILPVERNGGFAAGNNEGMRWYQRVTGGALPEFVWLLNPDTIPRPGSIAGLCDFLATHPQAGIAGSRCLWEDGRPRISAFRFHSPRTELIAAVDFGPVTHLLGNRQVALPPSGVPVRVDWVSGSSFMVRREVVERIGMMDEGYFLYFEEADYCARALEAGFESWHVPESVIVHIGGQATGLTGASRAINRRPRYWFASRARFFVRHYGVWGAHLANALWLFGYPLGRLIAALRGQRRDEPPHLWRDFLTNYYGPGGLMYRAKERSE